MNKITDFLQGKKTYIVVIVAIVFNTLVQYGVLDPSYTQYVNIVLSALGLGTLRAGIAGK
jgi:capsular polysaccharide biosynthesis protein